MSDEVREMSFWDHLEELRWTIFRSVIALFIFAIIGFIFMPYLFDSFVMAPRDSSFFLYKYLCKISSLAPALLPDFCGDSFHVTLINIKLTSQFFTHMTMSFYLALLVAFPYLIWEIWRFISPALYAHEKKSVRWVLLFGGVMFFIGCAIGYCLVFPMTLRFLYGYQLSPTIVNQIDLNDYMNMFLMLIMVMGLVFELPLVCWLLSQLGILKRSFFNKFRRHAIVILLILAAIITPSGDPFTLSVVFFPLYFLYELSSLLVKKDKPEDLDALDTVED